jgi:hypothetical protein
MGGFFRRIVIALDRGDKVPSATTSPDSRLLMRHNIRERLNTIAVPHLQPPQW